MTNKPLSLGRVLVVLTLVELIVIAGLSVWRTIVTNVDMSYVLIVCPLVCLEGLYSARLIAMQNLQTPDIWKFHAVELTGLALLVRLGAAFSGADFSGNLLTPGVPTAVGAVVCLLLWLAMLETALDFHQLDNPPDPALGGRGEYVSPFGRLTVRYFGGGALVLATTGFATVLHEPILPLIPVMFAYFVIGLLMLPGVRLQMARREWHARGIQAGDALAIPWTQAGLAVVGLALLIAILLPTGYLNGLLDFFRNLIQIVVMVVMFIVSLVTWTISSIIGPLLGAPDKTQPPPPQMPQLPPVANPEATAPNQFLELLPKLILMAVVCYILISYFRDHPELLAMVKKLRLVRILSSLWAALRRGLANLGKGIRVRLPAAVPNLFRRRASGAAPFRFIRLNGLSARERVLYFYLSTLRRAAEQGLPRAPAQTPREYSETLKPNLPESQPEFDHLSEAFVEARYSRHPIEPASAKQVQASWQRVRQALRHLKKT